MKTIVVGLESDICPVHYFTFSTCYSYFWRNSQIKDASVLLIRMWSTVFATVDEGMFMTVVIPGGSLLVL